MPYWFLGSERSPSVVRIRIEGLQAIGMAELLIRIRHHIQAFAEQDALSQ